MSLKHKNQENRYKSDNKSNNDNNGISNNNYSPDKAPKKIIVDYMKAWTAFEPEYNKLKYEGKNVSDNKTYQLLKQRKLRMLKVIYESMSNITEFLEYIAESEKLQEIFEEDLKDILLGKSADGTSSQFWKFMICATSYRHSKDENFDNFRLKLIQLMQEVVYAQTVNIASDRFGMDFANNTVGPAFNTVRAYTRMLSTSVSSIAEGKA